MNEVMKELEAMWERERREKLKKYQILNQFAKKGQIVFAGSSLAEGFPVNELLASLGIDVVIYNRGIGGYTTNDLLKCMDTCIFDLEPAKLFINIGSNDIGDHNFVMERLLNNYDTILSQISDRLPNCKVHVMAYYPINAKADFGIGEHKDSMFKTRTNENIDKVNLEIEKLAKKHSCEFINVNNGLKDEEGNLIEAYAIDGIHMWPNTYKLILDELKVYF